MTRALETQPLALRFPLHGSRLIEASVDKQHLFTHEPAILLAKELVNLIPGGKLTRAFFTDNGSTAIESGDMIAAMTVDSPGVSMAC